ncbi:MAG: hypothetical protein RLZZ175_2704 [Bacteroidota bacterium]|jgi:SNF2 family DNA or RNA helicase
MLHPSNAYILENCNFETLSFSTLVKHANGLVDTEKKDFYSIIPIIIEVNSGLFTNSNKALNFPDVTVTVTDNLISTTCTCNEPKTKLCQHQFQVIYNIVENKKYRTFFDKSLRISELKIIAKNYGLENENNLEQYFHLAYINNAVKISPKTPILPFDSFSKSKIENLILPQNTNKKLPIIETNKFIILLKNHKYYQHFTVGIFEANFSKDGKIKTPLKEIDALEMVWKAESLNESKFFTAIAQFQKYNENQKSDKYIDALKIIIKNPLQLPVYYHDTTISESENSKSLINTNLNLLHVDLNLNVDLRGVFFEIYGNLVYNDSEYELKYLPLKFDYFLLINNTLNLIPSLEILQIFEFFGINNPKILIHKSKFDEFKSTILDKLENKVNIKYSYIKNASASIIEETAYHKTQQKIIYLYNNENFVSLTPVVKYGEVEIPIFSRKKIYDKDANGNVFLIERDNAFENQFASLLYRQHPEFEEQLNEFDFFYLHKNKFLDENWFINVFDELINNDIQILGFSEISKNKINPYKAKVNLQVTSGIDWFNAAIGITYGGQKVELKQLHKSLRNKSKFVELGDGSKGVLPDEWIKKFESYFNSGEFEHDTIKIPKSNFLEINTLFEDEILSNEAKSEIELLNKNFTNPENIAAVTVPHTLKTTLREYQKQGLNWLNFLDNFNFGACLADDMGLGKTVQIIAFILSQREKHTENTNLVIVPTTLIFNWEEEIEKFAPSIKIHKHYGINRTKNTLHWNEYEVILTTYGMLIQDIHLLKSFRFNYVFLDESQAIKNPESQRYKAAKLLQSRNKVAITGTPIENNTYDIFAQMSIINPGLLGNKQYFKEIYSTLIDKFKDKRSSENLQKKINPFILRRTKKQVATELPSKTEMVIYCEMGAEQREIYTRYETELREYIKRKKEEDVAKDSMHVLTGITKLRQICNSPALLKDEVFLGENSAKIEALMEEIENKSSNHKILVFSQFVTMLDLVKLKLESKNISYSYLTGQTNNRAEKVNEFKSNDDKRVFLISLKAGGTGLNLTEADYVYIIDPWWNPAIENQAIDRCYRIGQTKNVIAVRLICSNSIEEKIIQLQKSKHKLVNDLIKSDNELIKLFNKNELLGLLG